MDGHGRLRGVRHRADLRHRREGTQALVGVEEPTALRPGQLAVRAGTAAAGGDAADAADPAGVELVGLAAANIAPSVRAGPPAQPHEPGPAPYAAAPVDPQQAWQAAWAPGRGGPRAGAGADSLAGSDRGCSGAASPTCVTTRRSAPSFRTSIPHLPPQPSRTSSVLSTAPPERYVGSAALESTLDSSIESSLLGLPVRAQHHDPVHVSRRPGGRAARGRRGPGAGVAVRRPRGRGRQAHLRRDELRHCSTR